jgi:hypothetical protein
VIFHFPAVKVELGPIGCVKEVRMVIFPFLRVVKVELVLVEVLRTVVGEMIVLGLVKVVVGENVIFLLPTVEVTKLAIEEVLIFKPMDVLIRRGLRELMGRMPEVVLAKGPRGEVGDKIFDMVVFRCIEVLVSVSSEILELLPAVFVPLSGIPGTLALPTIKADKKDRTCILDLCRALANSSFFAGNGRVIHVLESLGA